MPSIRDLLYSRSFSRSDRHSANLSSRNFIPSKRDRLYSCSLEILFPNSSLACSRFAITFSSLSHSSFNSSLFLSRNSIPSNKDLLYSCSFFKAAFAELMRCLHCSSFICSAISFSKFCSALNSIYSSILISSAILITSNCYN